MSTLNTPAIAITNLMKINEDKDRFLKENPNALEVALVSGAINAVNMLLQNGFKLSKNWKDLVEPGTRMYAYCDVIAKAGLVV